MIRPDDISEEIELLTDLMAEITVNEIFKEMQNHFQI